MNIVVLGLSLSSAWGNGHASTWRSLLRALAARDHRILFLERDVPWYRDHRDATQPDYADLRFYDSVPELIARFGPAIEAADLVVVGSYVPEGPAVIDAVRPRVTGVSAFYDIDTPITLAALADGDSEYLRAAQVPLFDVYLSFTGGPTLQLLEQRYGARRARALYCAVDESLYHPIDDVAPTRDLGYLGTYSRDRAAGLELRLIEPARRWPDGTFVVAGAQFPDEMEWPANVERREHVAPVDHAAFYASLRFTLNITRQAMREAGYAPSVRLFEAAACCVPIITDDWPGLATFFTPGVEILITDDAETTLSYLQEMSEDDRRDMATRARDRVLGAHTAAHRAAELEAIVAECRQQGRARRSA